MRGSRRRVARDQERAAAIAAEERRSVEAAQRERAAKQVEAAQNRAAAEQAARDREASRLVVERLAAPEPESKHGEAVTRSNAAMEEAQKTPSSVPLKKKK